VVRTLKDDSDACLFSSVEEAVEALKELGLGVVEWICYFEDPISVIVAILIGR